MRNTEYSGIRMAVSNLESESGESAGYIKNQEGIDGNLMMGVQYRDTDL